MVWAVKRTGDVAIILTATVSPSNTMPGSANNDRDARRDEYLADLAHYLAQDDNLIQTGVILENFGASPWRLAKERLRKSVRSLGPAIWL